MKGPWTPAPGPEDWTTAPGKVPAKRSFGDVSPRSSLACRGRAVLVPCYHGIGTCPAITRCAGATPLGVRHPAAEGEV